ncbi:MAG: Uma2 family endonuclease [Leptospiraceae bacterium]|nr:Uma2 family endonuclease [Leptospiraceae bacterium]
MNTAIQITLPEGFPVQREKLDEIHALNQNFSFEVLEHNLKIEEKVKGSFDRDFFKVIFPFPIQENFFDSMGEANRSHRLEFDTEGIIIHMGTFGLVGAFSIVIIAAIYVWNKKHKMGRIFDSSTNHDIYSQGISKRRLADISFIKYEKFNSKIIDLGYRLGSPTFCIEIVSNKNSLKENLEKMKNDWIPSGTELGLVVCPFRKKYYVFTGEGDYKTENFSVPFKNPILPGLILEFDKLLKEAMEETGE